MAYCRTVAMLSAIGLATAASSVQYPPAPAPRELSPSPSPMPVPSPSTPPPAVASPTPAPPVAPPVTAPTGQQPTWAPAPAVTAAPYVAPAVTPPPFYPPVLAPTGTPVDLGSSALTPELLETLREFPEKIRELPLEIRAKVEANPDYQKAKGTVIQAVTAVKNIPVMVDQLPAKFRAMPPDEQEGIVLGSAAGTAALAATIGAIAKAAAKNRHAAHDAAQNAETDAVEPHLQAKEVAMPVEPAPLTVGAPEIVPYGVTTLKPLTIGALLASPPGLKLKSLYVKKVEPAVHEVSGSGVDGLILGIGSFLLFSCFFVMVTGLLFYKFCGRRSESAEASRSFTRVSEEEDDDDDDEYA